MSSRPGDLSARATHVRSRHQPIRSKGPSQGISAHALLPPQRRRSGWKNFRMTTTRTLANSCWTMLCLCVWRGSCSGGKGDVTCRFTGPAGWSYLASQHITCGMIGIPPDTVNRVGEWGDREVRVVTRNRYIYICVGGKEVGRKNSICLLL